MCNFPFRIVSCFVHLITTYIPKGYLNQLDISDITIAVVYIALVINDFWLARFAYDNIVTYVFENNQKLLHDFFKYLR